MRIFRDSGYELYLVLSDLCNFSCAHCINSSGPKATRWNLDSEAVEALAEEINATPEVKAVHFTGGEPSLRLPQIRKLQSSLRHVKSYAMTSNGWFVDRSIGLLDEFKLNELTLSYDKFHRPFIEGTKLLPLIRHAQASGTQVTLNFVFEDLADLAEAEPFMETGATILTSRMVSAGRAEELGADWSDSRAIDRSCPSMDPDQRRRDDIEKIVHIPGRGFTPCCGPLAFDDLAEESFTFSKKLANYEANPLRTELGKGSFRAQAKDLGIDLEGTKLRSACDACRLLYGTHGATLPSLGRLFSQKEETAYYPSSERLDSSHESLLKQKFVVSYVYTASPEILPEADATPAPDGLLGAPLHSDDIAAVIAFTEENYFSQFPESYPESAREAFRVQATAYFARPDVHGRVYRKDGKLVACLYAHEYPSHPGLGEPTVHVGYWGYAREAVNLADARWIRTDWWRALREWNRDGRLIDVSIDSFNTSALRWIEKSGFKRQMLRLDRKALS